MAPRHEWDSKYDKLMSQYDILRHTGEMYYCNYSEKHTL